MSGLSDPRTVRPRLSGWMIGGALIALLLALFSGLVVLLDPGGVQAPAAPSSPEEPPETGAAVPGTQATDPSLRDWRDLLPAASFPTPGGFTNVQVQVVDEQGTPRGSVPVALLAGGRILDRTWTAGAQGLAWFTWPFGVGVERQAAAPAVVLAFPHADPAPVAFDPDSLPVEPLRLVLPPCGSVILRLSDPEGGALRERLPVTLSGYVAKDGVGSRVAGQACTIESEEGEARFPFVGLGLDLGLDVPGGAWTGGATRGPGPRRAGEMVRFELTLQKRAFLELAITGRVLKPGGEPLAGLECSCSLQPADYEREGAPGGRSRFRTDAFGGFRLSAGADLDGRGERRFLLLATTLATPDGPDLVSAEVELRLPFASGEIHVGDIPLASVPVVASGIVRDEAGSPVAGARVSAVVHRQVPEGGFLATSERSYSEGEWYWSPLAQAEADAAGRFRIQAFCKAALVGLQASAEGLPSNQRLSVPCGAAGIELVLGKPGRLEGSVLLSPGISPEILSVRLVAPPDETVERSTPGPDGTFRLAKIPPGVYRLELALERERQPLWSLPGLEMGPGTPPADPRLQRIDLRGRIRVIELLVEDERGRPIPGACATLLAEGTTIDGLPGLVGTREAWTGADGRAVLHASRSVLLEVNAPGRRARRLEPAAGPNRVVLSPGIPVKLILEEQLELPAPPFYLYARLAWTDDRGESREHWKQGAGPGTDGCLGAERSTRVLLPGPGRYRVCWSWLVLRPTGRSRSGLAGTCSVPEIQVLDQEQEQCFPVRLGMDGEAWRKNLERRSL